MTRTAHRIATLVVVTAVGALGACASPSPYRHGGPAAAARSTPIEPRAARPLERGVVIAELATEQVGIPYRYGGSHPREGFDCSGLVFYTYGRAGMAVPRSSEELFKAVRKISPELAAEGDLVFFQDQRRMSHVGIYVGDGLFVHAPSSGKTVRVSSLDSAYYRRHLVAVGRLLPY